jgi:acetolactate synthase-1/2/3 large subunit
VPAPEQKVIHLDIDPAEVGRIFRTDVGMIGDAKLGLEGLIDILHGMDLPSIDQEWLQGLKEKRAGWQETKAKLFASNETPIRPYRVMHELNNVMDQEDILVCDAGFATGWGAIYHTQRVPGRHSLFPRGLAGLGYAVAASIGAQLAAPDRRVVALAGDGGFTYGMPELATQALLGLPIVNVVLNNYAFGWVKWAEQAWYHGSFKASELQAIDFAKVAEGMGCVGIKVEDPADLNGALAHAFELNKPVVVEVITDAESTPKV